MTAEHGFEKSVWLLGHGTDAHDLCVAGELPNVSSRRDGLDSPRTGAPALSVPIIGSDAPCISEVLSRGGCDAIAVSGDAPGTSSLVARSLDDLDQHRRLATAHRKRCDARYEARYEPGDVVDAILQTDNTSLRSQHETGS